MKKIKNFTAVSVFFLSVFAVGCSSSNEITVRHRPVVPVVEKTIAPWAGYVWVNSRYVKERGRVVYKQGYWIAPRPGMEKYTEGYWRKSRGHYVWVQQRL